MGCHYGDVSRSLFEQEQEKRKQDYLRWISSELNNLDANELKQVYYVVTHIDQYMNMIDFLGHVTSSASKF